MLGVVLHWEETNPDIIFPIYDLILFEERKLFLVERQTLEALNYGMVEIERLSINCSVMMEMIMMMMNSW